VARKKFGVPEDDVNSLVQEVFLSFARSAETIREPRKWLVAAICNPSRSYWRRKFRDEVRSSEVPLESLEGSSCPEEAIALEMSIATMLSYLQEQCRDTLRMHYFEGRCSRSHDLARVRGEAHPQVSPSGQGDLQKVVGEAVMHIDEETLIGLASRNAFDHDVERHLDDCAECRHELDSWKALMDGLRQGEVWSRPRYERGRSLFLSSAESLHRRQTLFREVISKSTVAELSSESSSSLFHDAEAIRELLREAHRRLHVAPLEVLSISEAVVHAESAALTNELTALAHVERADALRYIGRYHDVLNALEKAESAFLNELVSDPGIARVRYIRAAVFLEMDRCEEAVAEVSAAAVVFKRFGDHRSRAYAALLHAAIRHRQGKMHEAFAEYQALLPVVNQLHGDEAVAEVARALATVTNDSVILDAAEWRTRQSLLSFAAWE